MSGSSFPNWISTFRGFNLAERGLPPSIDEAIVADLKKRFVLVGGPEALAAVASR